MAIDSLRPLQIVSSSIPCSSMSALPFTPNHTTLYETSHDKNRYPWIEGGYQSSWSPLLLVLSDHKIRAYSVAISPDGTQIATGSTCGKILQWDMKSGSQASEPLLGHKEIVRSVAFSADGKRIASGDSDRTIRIWDSVSGVLTNIARSFSLEEYAVWVWNFASGTASPTLLNSALPKKNSGVNFSPGGRCIVSWQGANFHVWEVDSTTRICSVTGLDHKVQSAAFSPDCQRIVCCFRGINKDIGLWSAMSGSKIKVWLCAHIGSFAASTTCQP
jgi:WD40 repeat protein